MNIGIMKVLTRAVLVTAVAVFVLSSGCGGGGGSTTTPPPQGEPDPKAYDVYGLDEVPDKLPGVADIGVVRDNGSVDNPTTGAKASGNGTLEVTLGFDRNAPKQIAYQVLTRDGHGTHGFKLTGDDLTGLKFDATTAGLLVFTPNATDAARNYTVFIQDVATSNGKVASSNLLKVNITLL